MRSQIEKVIGAITLAEPPSEGPQASPGLHHKHYSPRIPLLLINRQLPPGRGVYLYWNNPCQPRVRWRCPGRLRRTQRPSMPLSMRRTPGAGSGLPWKSLRRRRSGRRFSIACVGRVASSCQRLKLLQASIEASGWS